jgi:hypothetical protein
VQKFVAFWCSCLQELNSNDKSKVGGVKYGTFCSTQFGFDDNAMSFHKVTSGVWLREDAIPLPQGCLLRARMLFPRHKIAFFGLSWYQPALVISLAGHSIQPDSP